MHPHALNSACAQAGDMMKTEYRIREVTRYVITKHDGNTTQAVAEVDNQKAAKSILSALSEQASRQDPLSMVSLETIDLDDRWSRALRANGIETVADLISLSTKDLMDLPNIGLAGRLRIKLAMTPYGGLNDE
jgi:DNA-directed RNA polymerase alpha subunit